MRLAWHRITAIQFNHDISKWDVPNTCAMFDMHSTAVQFNHNIPKWDVSSIYDLLGMLSTSI